MPDFEKFRSGGELSDVQVSVEGELFKLHRFPLYTRSDFFLKEFAKQVTGNQVITLENFPGGREIFTVVADFCYNISVSITPENVLALKCAAKYLEMNGSGNLHEKTGLYIEDCIMNVKRGKELSTLLRIIASIPMYGGESETARVTQEQCVSAITYHWNKCQYGTSGIAEITSPQILAIFYGMQFKFFVQFMTACKSQLQNQEILNVLISEYILRLLQESERPSRAAQNDGDTMPDEKPSPAAETVGKAMPNEPPSPTAETDGDATPDKPEFTEEGLKKVQTLLDSLKPDLSSTKHPAAKWLKPMMSAYSKRNGSDEVIGGIAALMANQMDQECVSSMSEKTLLHFAETISADTLSEDVKSLLVEHMLTLSGEEALTADGFIRLSKILALSSVPVHDSVLLTVGNLSKQGQSNYTTTHVSHV